MAAAYVCLILFFTIFEEKKNIFFQTKNEKLLFYERRGGGIYYSQIPPVSTIRIFTGYATTAADGAKGRSSTLSPFRTCCEMLKEIYDSLAVKERESVWIVYLFIFFRASSIIRLICFYYFFHFFVVVITISQDPAAIGS